MPFLGALHLNAHGGVGEDGRTKEQLNQSKKTMRKSKMITHHKDLEKKKTDAYLCGRFLSLLLLSFGLCCSKREMMQQKELILLLLLAFRLPLANFGTSSSRQSCGGGMGSVCCFFFPPTVSSYLRLAPAQRYIYVHNSLCHRKEVIACPPCPHISCRRRTRMSQQVEIEVAPHGRLAHHHPQI